MTTSGEMRLDDLLGKEFRYGGRGPLEYDCYGLCMEVLRRRGTVLPDFGSAVLPSVIDRMVTAGRESFTQLETPEPFCLALFSVRRPYVSHIGVVLEDCSRFIHILAKSRVTIERLDSPLWQKKVVGWLRFDV